MMLLQAAADEWRVPVAELRVACGVVTHAALSEESGLPLGQCQVNRLDLGGGFGRRTGTQDYVRQAVAIARQFPSVPIKMRWSA